MPQSEEVLVEGVGHPLHIEDLTITGGAGPVAAFRVDRLDSSGRTATLISYDSYFSMHGAYSDLATGLALGIDTTDPFYYAMPGPAFFMDSGTLGLRDDDGTTGTWVALGAGRSSYTVHTGPVDGGTTESVLVDAPDPIVVAWPEGAPGACATPAGWLGLP
jgi:hypothetical protein